MNRIIFLAFLFRIFLASGQDGDSTRTTKFELGFLISPEYSFRYLQAEQADSWMRELYDTVEVPKVGFTAGTQLAFHFNKRLSMGVGLLFSDKGEKSKPTLMPAPNNYKNHFYYIDVPLKLNYYLIDKGCRFFISGGVAANFYMGARTTTQRPNAFHAESIGAEPTMSSLALAFQGGIGIDCRINSRWCFRMEPYFKRMVTSATNAPLKKYYYAYGLNLGLCCKL